MSDPVQVYSSQDPKPAYYDGQTVLSVLPARLPKCTLFTHHVLCKSAKIYKISLAVERRVENNEYNGRRWSVVWGRKVSRASAQTIGHDHHYGDPSSPLTSINSQPHIESIWHPISSTTSPLHWFSNTKHSSKELKRVTIHQSKTDIISFCMLILKSSQIVAKT